MISNRAPGWLTRAKEIAAKAGAPVGQPFLAKKSKTRCEIILYDAIGLDPWTGGGIDPVAVTQALADGRGSDELVVRISSPGGYVFDGISIYNAIRGWDGPKTVYVDGVAASIASVIALAGDNVITNDGAMWMVHDPWGGLFASGTADEIEAESGKLVASLRKVRENLLDIYSRQTGQPSEIVSGWMTAETWMTAAEALANGLTDEVAKDEPPKAKGQAAAKSNAARQSIAAMEIQMMASAIARKG